MTARTIRLAREDDIPDIISMTVEFERYLLDMDNRTGGKVLPPDIYEKVLRDGFSDEKHGFHVIEMDNELIGFADYWFHPEFLHGGRSAYLENLYIRKEYRGEGHGSAIMRRIMEEMKEKEIVAIHVPVMDTNLPAIEFYKKIGIDTVFTLMETVL